MRTVLLADMVAVACVLMALPEDERRSSLDQILYRAQAAHAVSKRLKRAHPLWGNGGLRAATAGWPQLREPFATDPDYLAALGLVVAALAARGRRKAERRTAALGLLPPSPMC